MSPSGVQEAPSARRPVFRLAFAATLAVGLLLLLMPGDAVVATKLWIASWLPYAREIDQADWTAHSDKLEHGLLFALLGALGRRAWQQRHHRAVVIAGLVAVGVLTEWLQAYVPGRSASPWDFAADVLGLALGWWVARHWGGQPSANPRA